ncbi:MAG: hypothetical protein ACRDPY_37580 [Streptosporangiaceae bacterium]
MSDLKERPATAAGSSVRWPRIAVTAVFVVHGLLFASWTAHIPGVKEHLGLTDGTLGFALLGAPVGSVTAMIAFAAMLCEGATADWSAVYLSGPLHTSGVVPGLAYAVFSLAMVTVRRSGNRLLTRFRPGRLLPALAAVATAGFAAALLIAQPPAALLGFGCLGIGLASVIPAVFSAAGRIPGLPPGTAVATASACGWAGFVCGPSVIGRLSAWASLPVALGLLPLLTAFLIAGTLSSRALREGQPRAHAQCLPAR